MSLRDEKLSGTDPSAAQGHYEDPGEDTDYGPPDPETAEKLREEHGIELPDWKPTVRSATHTSPREAFDTNSVRVGDVIRYPARLRPEHKCTRSNQLVVLRIEDDFLRCGETVDGKKQEWTIYPMQLRDNGVLVEAHID